MLDPVLLCHDGLIIGQAVHTFGGDIGGERNSPISQGLPHVLFTPPWGVWGSGVGTPKMDPGGWGVAGP